MIPSKQTRRPRKSTPASRRLAPPLIVLALSLAILTMIINRLPNATLPPTPPIGANLRRAREACGLTLREMADLLGFGSATAILLYEQEKRQIDAPTLWKFASICGIGVETLFITP